MESPNTRLLQGEPAPCNLGTRVSYSVREGIRMGGHRVSFKEAPRRPGDPPVLVARAQKAASELRWKARFGPEEIIRTAWRWHSR